MDYIIKNVLVYVVMVTVLHALISHPGYQELFRFVCGMLFILLFVSPLLDLLSDNTTWKSLLQKNLFQMDRKEWGQEWEVTEGDFTEMLKKQYTTVVEKQVAQVVQQEGEKAGKILVQVAGEGAGEIRIHSVTVVLAAQKEEVAGGKIVIDPVQIQPKEDKTVKKTTTERTRRLRSVIAQQLQIQKEVVKVWQKMA